MNHRVQPLTIISVTWAPRVMGGELFTENRYARGRAAIECHVQHLAPRSLLPWSARWTDGPADVNAPLPAWAESQAPE